jgi:hypothetical protein
MLLEVDVLCPGWIRSMCLATSSVQAGREQFAMVGRGLLARGFSEGARRSHCHAALELRLVALSGLIAASKLAGRPAKQAKQSKSKGT